MPIFKKFIENAIYKEEIKHFKVPETINFFPVNYDTGENIGFNENKAIIEAFKESNVDEIKLKNLKKKKKRDKFMKFTRFY